MSGAFRLWLLILASLGVVVIITPGLGEPALKKQCNQALRDFTVELGYVVSGGREFTIISLLSKVPPQERKRILLGLEKSTKWGTLERAALCYASAWYGIHYERSRDYLLNVVLWCERGHDKNGKVGPKCWSEDTLTLLYRLFKWNHDFRLLHDILTAPHIDGAWSMVLGSIKDDALEFHPHAVLHVARLSSKAQRNLAQMLVDTSRVADSQDNKDFKRHVRARGSFVEYAERVANDLSDPLRSTARSLLNEVENLQRKPK